MPNTKGMEIDPATLLQLGITAAKHGDKDQARTILLQVLELDDRNKKAWLWLSDVIQDPREKAICLENVLTLDPINAAAHYGLQKLNIQYPGIFDPHPEDVTPKEQPEPLFRMLEEDKLEAPPANELPPQKAGAGRPGVKTCIHCGAPNPGWRKLCSVCNKPVDGGADLAGDWKIPPEPEEENEPGEVSFETEFDSRPLGILTLGAAWIAAISLNKRGAYEYEVFSPSAGRTITGIVIGVVAIPSLVIFMAGLLLTSSRAANTMDMITSLATTPFLLIAWSLAGAVGAIVHFYSWSAINYVIAWVLGGKGSFLVHSQLLSIAFSAGSLAGSILMAINGSLVAVLVELAPENMIIRIILLSAFLTIVLNLLVSIYSSIMQAQALSVAHRFSWGTGIGTMFLSSLIFGLLAVLFIFFILSLTNFTLGNLINGSDLFLTPIP
ncbi:MAG: YIP1 family protein [Anaerolineales bacterium]|nr:YIP1 family protein [Anaerolineales bacterium]